MSISILNDQLDRQRYRLDELLKNLQQFTFDIGSDELQKIVSDLRSNVNDPFLFVVVGEVKSGKSSFVNALLGASICKVDPAPCTDVVQELVYAEQQSEADLNPHLRRIGLPFEILKTIAIVDTPGTNTVIENHQKITQDFIPKSDLVLFVFPAKNPHTKSSWTLLDYVSDEWRKKVIFILQQADLARPDELAVNIAKVKEYAAKRNLLSPRVFATSAAIETDGQQDQSGFSEVRHFIREQVTGGRHYVAKLQSVLATGEQIISKIESNLLQRQQRLEHDQALVEKIKSRLATGEEQSGYETRALVDRLVTNYDRIADEVKVEFKEGLSIFMLFKKTFSSLFDKDKSINAWIADLQKSFESRLNTTFEEISGDGSKHFVEGIRRLLRSLLDDLQNNLDRRHEDELFIRVGEQRQEVIREVEKNVAKLLSNDSFVHAVRSGAGAIVPTVMGGGVLAIIGTIILTAAKGAFFDVTGGVLTGTGVLLAGGVLFFKKGKIIREFEEGLDRGRKRFASELKDRLAAKLKMIYEDVDRSFVRFYDYVRGEEKKVGPLVKQFAGIKQVALQLAREFAANANELSR